MVARTSFTLLDGELLVDPTKYKSMVGAFQYLTMTWPDINYAIHVVSQFMHAPHTTHVFGVKRIFKYLQGTLADGILLCSTIVSSITVAYSDVDWVGCKNSCRSTTGHAVFFSPNFIAWCSKKQLSKSSIEADYRVVAYVIAEIV